MYRSIIHFIVITLPLYKKSSDIVVMGRDEKLNYLGQRAVVV